MYLRTVSDTGGIEVDFGECDMGPKAELRKRERPTPYATFLEYEKGDDNRPKMSRKKPRSLGLYTAFSLPAA